MEVSKIDYNNNEIFKSLKLFINNISGIDVKQTPEWLNFRDEKGFALYCHEKEKIIAYCNVFVEDNFCYIPRGPIVLNNQLFNECLIHICDYLKQTGFNHVILNPKIDYKIQMINEIKYVGNDFSLLKESYREAIVYLENNNEENLLAGFNNSTRYHIRKSLKNSLEVFIFTTIPIDDFYELYLETALRHNFKPHPKSYFIKLMSDFQDKIVCCQVKLKDKTIAMSINILQNDSLFYLYGASLSNDKFYATYLMHWTMIKYALSIRCRFYNFGGVFANDDDYNSKDYGLLQFKKGFCATGFTEYISDMIVTL